MTLLIADISSHNTITSWPAFLGSVDGVIVKISEGIGYTWPGAPAALTQARNAGKLVGVYHFARVNDPVAEADYFLAHYSHRPGEVIVLDWEPSGFTGDADAWAYAWCRRVIAATGVVPMVYLNSYYATRQSQWPRTRSLGCGLWAAWYGANTGQPLPGMPSFAPWPAPAMWQYTSNGTRPGVSGVIDLNQFYGTPDQWRAYGGAGAPIPAVAQEDEMRIIQNATRGIAVVGPGYYHGLSPSELSAASALYGSPVVFNDPAQFDLAVSVATGGDPSIGLPGTLAGYGYRIERIDEGAHGGWGYGARIEDTQAKVDALGQQAAPVIDEAALAAALLADPKNVDALGAAIAAHLKLSSD